MTLKVEDVSPPWLTRIVIDVHLDGYSVKCSCGLILFVAKFEQVHEDLWDHIQKDCPLTRWRPVPLKNGRRGLRTRTPSWWPGRTTRRA